MRHSKCAPSLPVTYHPSPRSLTCSPLTYQLSPRSGASGYQNRVHKNHEYLIICPQHAILAGFLSDRLITWASTARSRPCHLFASHLTPALAQRRHLFPAISRRLSPPLLFTFHLTPALAQRGTLPNPSAHTLANGLPAPGANPPTILWDIADQAWQTGRLAPASSKRRIMRQLPPLARQIHRTSSNRPPPLMTPTASEKRPTVTTPTASDKRPGAGCIFAGSSRAWLVHRYNCANGPLTTENFQ